MVCYGGTCFSSTENCSNQMMCCFFLPNYGRGNYERYYRDCNKCCFQSRTKRDKSMRNLVLHGLYDERIGSGAEHYFTIDSESCCMLSLQMRTKKGKVSTEDVLQKNYEQARGLSKELDSLLKHFLLYCFRKPCLIEAIISLKKGISYKVTNIHWISCCRKDEVKAL